LDFNRIDPINEQEHFESIIAEITQMESEQTHVMFKSSGDVKNELYSHYLKNNGMKDAAAINGFEFLLKQFGFIEQDDNIVDLLRASATAQTYGYYDPATKSITIIEGTANSIVSKILLHELVHAAQDTEIDLTGYLDQYCNSSFDRCLAAKSLLEGQANTVNWIIQANRNIQNNNEKDLLKIHLMQMNNESFERSLRKIDYFPALNVFPIYYGSKFVLQQYINGNLSFPSMFERIPISTEQLIHYDKYQKNEIPVKTILETKSGSLATSLNLNMLLDTTFGENYIRRIFSTDPSLENKTITTAAKGWGGDRISVFQSKDNLFFIWDILWDENKDAEEFYKTYLDFSKNRLGIEKKRSHNIFQTHLSNDNRHVFLVKKKNRVIILEGNIYQKLLEDIAKAIKI